MSSSKDDHDHGDDGQGHGGGPFGEGQPEQGDAKNRGPCENGDDHPYEVGYRRPPKHSRVVKGQVLNSKGRPKGSKNKPKETPDSDLRSMILRDAQRMITINDASGPLTITAAEAVRRAQFVSSMKGSVRGQRDFLDLLRMAEDAEKREREMVITATIDYKMKWEEELARRRKLRLKGAEPLIHPDNIMLNGETGEIAFLDPITNEEKAALAPWKERRAQLQKELDDLRTQRNDPNCPNRDEVLKEIETTTTVLTIIAKAFEGSRQAAEILNDTIVPDEEEE